ncbi:hypothetical protein QW71_34155 [Paenibacillus sp. IHB B 3415]|nr:hypothetical protein QW71_34155 [Paenibacillus sp. IHB B 3415]
MWGSGKTHFWNTELRPAIESVQGESGLLRTVYVSLYGISSTDEISQKIVYGIYAAKISAKTKKRLQGDILPEIGKVILNVGSAIGGKTENLLSEGAKALNSIDKLFNIKKDIVLCFDDLERASMDVHLIMGYINNLVEHDNIKSIIIGNEDEIVNRASNLNQELKNISSTLLLNYEDVINKLHTQKNSNSNFNQNEDSKLSNQELIEAYNKKLYSHKNEYKMIKEKLIGKTLTYKAIPEKIIKNILKGYEQEDYGAFLKQNLSLIQEVIKNSNTNNFRILQHTLDDFEVVFKEQEILHSDIETSIKLNILTKMFHFMLAYAFELKSGNPDVKHFKDFKTNGEFMAKVVVSKLYKNDDEYKGVIRFREKYFNFSYGDFYKTIETIVREGTFNKELFASEFGNEVNEVISQNKPDYFYLLNEDSYKLLSDDDFGRMVDETYKRFKNGEITFYHYIHGFYMYRKFSAAGLFPLNQDVIYMDFVEGLDKTFNNSRYLDKDRLNTQLSVNYPEDNELVAIREKIILINKQLERKLIKQRADEIFQLFVTHDIEALFKKLDEPFPSKFFFSLIKASAFLNKLLTLPNPELALLIKGLKNRYESNYKKDQLKDEKPFFNELKTLIIQHFNDKEMSLRKHIFMDLASQIDTLFEMNENG